MNAIDPLVEQPRMVSSVPHPTHKFGLLLRREFWEHKGGFLWAPLLAGGVFLGLSLILFRVNVNGADLGALLVKASVEDQRGLGQGVDVGLYMASSLPLIALAFVVFFYCLGALYDERKDRSVLFWKSLPLSDREVVLSKVVSAVLVAPGLVTVIAIVTMFGFLGVISLIVLAHGHNPALLWEAGHPFAVAGSIIVSLPVYVVWALPTIGWLLLCSAWAKNRPFLWAIMIPVFAGIFVTWFRTIYGFDLEPSWFWKNIVWRVLFSTMPGAWLAFANGLSQSLEEWPELIMSLSTVRRVFATPQPWIGAVAGAVMIYGAIRVRRWRDEG